MPVDGRVGQGADIRVGFRHMLVAGSRQLGEQRSCLFEIGRGETFGEPNVDRREEIAGCGAAITLAAAAEEILATRWRNAQLFRSLRRSSPRHIICPDSVARG
jgi:hypothetical protein